MSRLWRVFPWDPAAEPAARGHPLWIPRELQGAGRHDNPDLYGAMYPSERPLAAVAEQLAHLRGQRLDDTDLERSGMRLALAPLDAAVDGRLWDLDDPQVLVDRHLRGGRNARNLDPLNRATLAHAPLHLAAECRRWPEGR